MPYGFGVECLMQFSVDRLQSRIADYAKHKSHLGPHLEMGNVTNVWESTPCVAWGLTGQDFAANKGSPAQVTILSSKMTSGCENHEIHDKNDEKLWHNATGVVASPLPLQSCTEPNLKAGCFSGLIFFLQSFKKSIQVYTVSGKTCKRQL